MLFRSHNSCPARAVSGSTHYLASCEVAHTADSPGGFVATMSEHGVVIHTFEAEMSDELTVRTGEQVQLPSPATSSCHIV